MNTSVHLISLGCARNDVDSEELAARLDQDGFCLVDDPDAAEVIMVNTCGFIEQAKKDSIDTLLAASDHKSSGRAKAVVAVGCMAERYGTELAEALPEADAVLGFDAYPKIAGKLKSLLDGNRLGSHTPVDRRTLLPAAPNARQDLVSAIVPGHSGIANLPTGLAPASGPRVLRRRLHTGPFAPLKIASGCDRRCAFCAIPSFRGSYLSRPIDEIVTEARWLASQGVREVMLVSENTSSYGKDLGIRHPLPTLLERLSGIEGLEWIRVSYVQPAEITPDMLTAITSTEKVVPYFDISFQHASQRVLRRMRRFGDPESFIKLLGGIREAAPNAGVRSNFIVGFPGEEPEDVEILADFICNAAFDAAGVFAYSDEEHTEGASLDGHVEVEEIAQRHARIAQLIDEVCDQRAAERVGERVTVLAESLDDQGVVGRAAHQGPEVDGTTTLLNSTAAVGQFVDALVVDSIGVDLLARTVD
ncbi:ribosomal protein S12 methylthiotransferase RimO [Propionibacterium sp. oral taxon 192 str. F0372]|uniref:30S ribosomal protein S12 methylthiotransferase RimO n=1 Tax=Propionibacterium sp. oral taxon 192 TaxID=671222 RepID=UPI0003546A90|nr:30S ribosomal protein S12 methylthiotransferase RimO [Propionibacterium sp. oral taxon 192]EPH02928.1 ribosomal protein S12 methylthiotransferase RimO [Propionibacterium sp. oral taxon 192 str. F0372]